MVNLAVAVKPSDQVQPKIRPTPDGGCYIRWFDNDPSGNPPLLLCSPFPVSSILSSKSRLDLTLSSTGVALAAWSDGRNDSGDIYAQDIKADCTLGQ